MDGHVRAVAALQIGFSILGFITAIIIHFVLNTIGNFVDNKEAELVLSIVANLVSIFLFVTSIPGLIAGLGLFKRKEWARILTLIIAILNLFCVPIGTAYGVYAIWVMVQNDTIQLFDSNKSIQN